MCSYTILSTTFNLFPAAFCPDVIQAPADDGLLKPLSDILNQPEPDSHEPPGDGAWPGGDGGD